MLLFQSSRYNIAILQFSTSFKHLRRNCYSVWFYWIHRLIVDIFQITLLENRIICRSMLKALSEIGPYKQDKAKSLTWIDCNLSKPKGELMKRGYYHSFPRANRSNTEIKLLIWGPRLPAADPAIQFTSLRVPRLTMKPSSYSHMRQF